MVSEPLWRESARPSSLPSLQPSKSPFVLCQVNVVSLISIMGWMLLISFAYFSLPLGYLHFSVAWEAAERLSDVFSLLC